LNFLPFIDGHDPQAITDAMGLCPERGIIVGRRIFCTDFGVSTWAACWPHCEAP